MTENSATGIAAPFASAKIGGYVPSEEEKKHAFYAHLFGSLSVLVAASSGLHLLGPLIPMIMRQERTPFVMFHINQSFWFQAVLFALNVIVGVLAVILMFFCIGWLLFPINGLLVLTAIIYPIFIGLRAKDGEWAEYPVVGEKVLSQKSPVFN
jgi:uncharacterized membrane protein